jgi:hypothetical protein
MLEIEANMEDERGRKETSSRDRRSAVQYVAKSSLPSALPKYFNRSRSCCSVA